MRLTGLILVALSNTLPKVLANPIINRGGNLVNFMWWGTQSQEICWRPNNSTYANIPNTPVPCCQKWATQQVPTGWQGNFWPMTYGSCNPPAGVSSNCVVPSSFPFVAPRCSCTYARFKGVALNIHSSLSNNANFALQSDEGVIGEIAFQGFNDKTFYDVSAIDSNSNLGIHWIYPTSHFAANDTFWSGCFTFGCPNAYEHSGDECTKVTPETSLNVLMGSGI